MYSGQKKAEIMGYLPVILALIFTFPEKIFTCVENFTIFQGPLTK